MKRYVLILALGVVQHCVAQDPILYSDWIDSVQVAKAGGDYADAQKFYFRAFRRRQAIAVHAIDCARVSWLVQDTMNTQAYANLALDLGITGPEMEFDSTLKTYWPTQVASWSRNLWNKYKAMELSELKQELEAMFRADQDARKALDWDKADSPDSLVRRSVWQPVEALDSVHTARALEIIDQHGVPSIHQVGLTGNKMIFFAFIHAKNVESLGAYTLLLSASVRKGDSPACWYAYVIDRIMVDTSKETMFGTTGYTNRTDDITYFTPVSSKYVDLLREEVGIPRLSHGRSFY